MNELNGDLRLLLWNEQDDWFNRMPIYYLIYCFIVLLPLLRFFPHQNQSNYIYVINGLFFLRWHIVPNYRQNSDNILRLPFCVCWEATTIKMGKNISLALQRLKQLPRSCESQNHKLSVKLKLTPSPFPTLQLTLSMVCFSPWSRWFQSNYISKKRNAISKVNS